MSTVSPLMESTHHSFSHRVYDVMAAVGLHLDITVDRSEFNVCDDLSVADADPLAQLVEGARRLGILIQETEISGDDLESALLEGFPLIIALEDGDFWLLKEVVGRRIEVTHFGETVAAQTLSKRQARRLAAHRDSRVFIAKKELECEALSGSIGALSNATHGSHIKPFRRFITLLKLDRRDIWTVTLFAMVGGILTLATPLAIESLVNVVSWGTYVQPLLVLACMLLACLALAGIMRVLQTVVVEIIQRRQFVRLIGDLAHRFPRVERLALQGTYSREFANRLFDIMTIQKATAVLLLDGLSIVLTTGLGLLLLAFYHPYLLGFSLVLLFTMISLTWVLGRGGIKTAIDESVAKYRIAHWLQDVISLPVAFKVNGGESLAIDRANRLTADYLAARRNQFRVIIRQVIFAMSLQVVASTVLLGLGGWLVISQQLTLGQLVASELVVTVVVGAFSKAGKSLEQYYDLMAGIDKVGHLLDLPVDERFETGQLQDGPARVRWEDLRFYSGVTDRAVTIPAACVNPGAMVALTGDDHQAKTMLLKTLAGLEKPSAGSAEVAGLRATLAGLAQDKAIVGCCTVPEIFHGSIRANVDLARDGIGRNRVQDALRDVGLWEHVVHFPKGLSTELATDGYPLSDTQKIQLSLARAMVGRPRLLIIDGQLDALPEALRKKVMTAIKQRTDCWTVLIATQQPDVMSFCEEQISWGTHLEEETVG